MLQIELKRLCRTLKKTVLFVTHDVDEAIGLADRCVVFSERPETIRRVIEVDLPPDRDIKTLRFDSSYVEQCAELWRILTPAIEAQASQGEGRSEEHTSELQSLMRISYAVFCLKKKKDKENYKERVPK